VDEYNVDLASWGWGRIKSIWVGQNDHGMEALCYVWKYVPSTFPSTLLNHRVCIPILITYDIVSLVVPAPKADPSERASSMPIRI
jgi:hypothetical protein